VLIQCTQGELFLSVEAIEVQKPVSLGRRVLWALLGFILVSLVALYFRTYLLRAPDVFQYVYTQRLAKGEVQTRVQKDIENQIRSRFPDIPKDKLKRVVEQRAAEALEKDPEQFESIVMGVADKLMEDKLADRSRTYLLGADSYYYYYLTRRLYSEGSLGKADSKGMFRNEMRRFPRGVGEWINWHPYVGYHWTNLARRLFPDLDLMTALSYLPLVLTIFVIGGFFLICHFLKARVSSSVLGALLLVLTPIFIQRSCFGWYDTDLYNLLFPIGVVLALFAAIRYPRWTWAAACVGGFLSGLYALFWSGWPFLLGVISGAAVLIYGLHCWQKRHWKDAMLLFIVLFSLTALATVMLLLSPAVLFSNLSESTAMVQRFAGIDYDLWPSALAIVGETRGITFHKLVHVMGGYASFLLAVMGTIISLILFSKRKDNAGLSHLICVLVMLLPVGYLALRSERFSLLCALPLAILLVFGFDRIQDLGEWAMSKKGFQTVPRLLTRVFLLSLLAGVFIPSFVSDANAIATKMKPIVDDNWQTVFTKIQQETPEEAVIHSWWPPGYLIIALANRRVYLDGGSQHLTETYWVARAYMTEDEREAVGILRMLNVSGNQAVPFLLAKDFKLSDAIDYILEIVPLTKRAAREIMGDTLAVEDIDALLNLTHGESDSVPTYTFIYDDLIKQNLALSVMSRWNFRKAEMMSARRARYGKQKGQDNLQYLVAGTGKVLRYSAASALLERKDSMLRFRNGVSVDLTTMQARISRPGMPAGGSSVRLFHLKDGRLVEDDPDDQVFKQSALLIEKDGEYTSLLADAELIRSMLFRLYYLEGQGLELFKPFAAQEGRKTKIYVYEIDWSKL